VKHDKSAHPPRFPNPYDMETYNFALRAVKKYQVSLKELKELGVSRSERSLQADFAEWIVARLLDLELSESQVEANFDAIDHLGNRYQIKSRILSSLAANTSFDFRKKPKGFEYLVTVFFDEQLNLLGVVRVPISVVVEFGSQYESRFSFRWKAATRQSPNLDWIYRYIDDAA